METITDLEKQQLLPEKTPKRLSRKLIVIAIIISFFIIGAITIFTLKNNTSDISQKNTPVQNSPTPKKEEPFGMYSPPKIAKKDVYTIFMVGDSMTEALGPHGGKLNEFINTLYQSTPGNQRIVIDNYASGSTNLLGLYDVMKKRMIVGDAVLDPLLSRPFDILLIESFGYNPLSQLGHDEGLKKQTQTLDELMKIIIATHPQSVIVFVATIAPNKETYGLEVSLGKTISERTEQAEERMDYIKNHIAYAKAHNIPLIDIYSKSLTPEGNGDIANINPNDHIHPSFSGVDFISQEIANFIYENQILPR